MKTFLKITFYLLFANATKAQTGADTVVEVGRKVITLSPVVIGGKLDVPSFINVIKNDSSFYKAFKNLRILNFDAINDIRMVNKAGELNASLYSKTQQIINNGCRSMKTLEQTATGDFYNSDSTFNYYTANMYASLFFTKEPVCGETNIVAGSQLSTKGKSGMDKHKEQLKMLFFNPGRRIHGLPFMSNKTAIYSDDMASVYYMHISEETYNGKTALVFHQKVKPGSEDKVVVDEMTTWFNAENYEVLARNYSLSYSATVYDFKVQMEVKMTTVNGLTVPELIRYNGNWKAIFKKRERGIFTATLSNFK
jgi:hypothetical protein